MSPFNHFAQIAWALTVTAACVVLITLDIFGVVPSRRTLARIAAALVGWVPPLLARLRFRRTRRRA